MNNPLPYHFLLNKSIIYSTPSHNHITTHSNIYIAKDTKGIAAHNIMNIATIYFAIVKRISILIML